jgi:4-amino-4-deoxy-L-arabinose transferase-like glycosyltransferase
MALAFAAFGMGLIALLASSVNRKLFTTLGYSLLVIAMLITPGAWSILTNINTSANQSLPAAYSGQPSGPADRGNTRTNDALLNFLQTNTQGMKYLLAVPSSMQGADYVIATGRPVLYMGGFNGQDDVVSVDELSQLVNNGELRYVYWGQDPQSNGKSDISNWVSSSCQVVRGFDTATRNAGAPDGTGIGGNTANAPQNTDGGPGQNIQVTLYDCGT